MNLLDLGRNPIPGDNPAGMDVSFEPEFEALEGELQKMSSPTASGAVDWTRVADLARGILEKKSKHLLVAGYLCFALFKTGGMRGLAGGVRVMREVVETWWEGMYPPKKRMRGRVNAVAWWADKIGAGVEGIAAEQWPVAEYEALADDLAAIDSFLGDNMENAPILRSLNERILGAIEPIAPEPEPEPEPAAPDPAPAPVEAPAAVPSAVPASTPPRSVEAPKPAAAPAPAPPAPDLSDTDADKLLRGGLQALRQAGSLLMRQDRLTPLPYRLTRLGSWLGVTELPPSSGGRTMLPQPDDMIVTILQNLSRAGNWADLLEAAESRVPQYLFWLDLSRYAAEALAGLGRPGIADLVAGETAEYAERLSGIEKLAFSDGLPFADAATRTWLAETAAKRSGAAPQGDTVESAVTRALAEAQQRIGENQLDAALDGFRANLDRGASARERFLWTAGLCRLLMGARAPRLLVPYIREILAMVDTHGLERWEPDLAVEGFALVLTGLRLQEGERDEALFGSVLNRIAAIRPARALEFMT